MRIRSKAKISALVICGLLLLLNFGNFHNSVAASTKTEIEFWWWGEVEAPGLLKWVNETADLFEQRYGIRVKTVRQTVDSIIPGSLAAAQAKIGPDVQYLWPGGDFLGHWLFSEYLAPLDKWLPNEIKHYNKIVAKSAIYKGHIYAAPFYLIGNPWVYNKELFKKAGLDPNEPPKTWDEFLAVGEKLKAAGIIPWAGGMKDQWFAGFMWIMMHPSIISSEVDWMGTQLGQTSAASERYVEYWKRAKELIDRGFFPKDVMGIDYYAGLDRFLSGEAAMACPVQPQLHTWADKIGGDKVIGIFLPPLWKDYPDSLAGKLPTSTQFIGITSWSRHKKEAAEFIKFTHTKDRMKALYDYCGGIAADDRFDFNWIKYEYEKQLLRWTRENSFVSSFYVNTPPVETQAIWPCTGWLFTGEKTPKECAQYMESVLKRWRLTQPDQVKGFSAWMESFVK